MNDPYSVLGVNANATEDEVKRAYRDLARKYHPDNYQNNPLSDLAEEKMKEVNEAYDAITRQRSGGSFGGTSYQQSGQSYQQTASSGNPIYARVRSFINTGNLDAAEQVLQNEAPTKNGEWFFLMGSIAYRKGWLDEARQNYQLACQMEPGNMEYRQALNLMQQGGQAYRPYGYSAQPAGASACDCCTSLMCINCLCGGGNC